MEKERPVADNDSDSSSGLPDLDTLFPKYTFDITKLKKNDIVWAEYKDLHWPALVRNVDKKNKKVSVWYLDSPGKAFKLPYKKILSYNDIDTNEAVQMKASKSPFAEKHSRVCTRTLLFFENIKRGINVNPIEFFDLSKPFFMVTDYYPGSSKYNSENTSTPKSSESPSSIENTSTLASSEFKFNNENTSISESSPFNDEKASTEKTEDKDVYLEDNSDSESSTKSEEVQQNMQDHTSVNSFQMLSELPSPYDEEMVDKISSCIIAGHVDNYLVGIYNFQIKSEMHESYMKALKTDSRNVMWCIPKKSVPISNEKLSPITVHLYNLFKKEFGEEVGWRSEYIILVWLPEAVDKAVSLIKAESLKLPVDSGSNVSSSHSFVETSKLFVETGSSKLSTLPCQVEAPDLPVNSSSCDSFSVPNRKLNLVSASVKNDHDPNVLDTEVSASKKIKVTRRKKRKV